MYILTKASEPGWEEKFETEEEVRLKLLPYICPMCRAIEGVPGGSPPDLNNLDDLLGTACGCEFWLEKEEE